MPSWPGCSSSTSRARGGVACWRAPVALLLAIALGACAGCSPSADVAAPVATDAAALAAAYRDHASGGQVEGSGIVVRILADDTEGSRHQRFILRLDSGQTVLVAHNIDLAPRIAGLQRGDEVGFAGTYEWNPKGGTVHWTHHDPAGRHPPGWLRHRGRSYR